MSFPRLCKTSRLLALLCLARAFAAAQSNIAPLPPGAPTSSCEPPAAPDFAHLRVLNGTAPVPRVYDCGSQGNPPGVCFTQLLDLAKPDDNLGDLIAPGATEGAWSCAMMGGWSGWIPSDRLTAVPATPAITTQQWLGTWINTHVGMTRDRLILTRSATGQGKIHVEGRAHYTNAAHNVHLGGLNGEALAMGPFLHILDQGGNDGCVLDLKYNLPSNTLRAVDNHRCGGFNVTFNGVWHRASERSR